MADRTPRHRLTAVWFADVVEFSSMAHVDEDRALGMVRLLQDLVRAAVDRFDGQVVKFMGDGAFAEFPSIESAVRSACELRDVFREHSEAAGLGGRDLRIGIHLGEVATLPDGDLYGDGVNLAARIKEAADPGQVLVSRTVWEQLRQRSEFAFSDRGPRDLKGTGSTQLFSVRVEGSEAAGGDGHEVPIRDLGPALRRPRVLRAGVVYVGVAVLAILLALTILRSALAPRWIVYLVLVLAALGLVGGLANAALIEVRRRRSRLSVQIGRLKPRSWLFTRVIRMALLALAIPLGAAGVWIGWDRWLAGPGSISASTIVILPFEVGGDRDLAYLERGMVNLVSTKLDGVEELRSVDPHALFTFLDQRGIADLDPALGSAVARRFGAGHYLLGNVVAVGGRLHMDASLYASSRLDQPVARVTSEGRPEDIMRLVDQLVARLLVSQLGEANTPMTSLATITTDSLDALKAYLEGEREYQAGRLDEALDAFQRAVTIDSLFALAHYRIAITASWVPDYSIIQTSIDSALRNADRLTPNDRTLVDAFYALQTGQPARARGLLRPFLDAHPENVEAWYLYGDVLFHYNALRGRTLAEARPAFERVRELNPRNNEVLSHLMEIDASQGAFGSIDSLIGFLDPDSDLRQPWRSLREMAIGTSPARKAVVDDLAEAGGSELRVAVQKIVGYAPDPREVDRVARLLLDSGRSEIDHRAGRIWLAQIRLRGGRWEDAQQQLAGLASIDPGMALQLLAIHSTAPFIPSTAEELRALRASAETWPPGDDPLDHLYRSYVLGLLSLRLGDTRAAASARAALDETRGDPPAPGVAEFLAANLSAIEAYLDGDDERALASFGRLEIELPAGAIYRSPFLWHPLERYLRAETLFRSGRYDEAEGWYRALAIGSSWLHPPFESMAHYRLGEIHEQRGDSASAERHYAKFIELWSEADPELQPLVVDGRGRLERLRNQ